MYKSQDYHPAGLISFGSTHGKAEVAGAWQGALDITCIKATSGKTKDASCCPTFFVNKSAVKCSGDGATWCPADDYYTKAPGNGIITDNPACTTCKTTPASCFKDTQSMWLDHCLSTGDSEFAKNLTSKTSDIVVKKGTNKFVDAYSAFMDNSRFLKTSLDATLQADGITELYIAGIATDVCVKWSVRDALSSETGNYTVKVIEDASAGIYAGTGVASAAEANTWFTTQGASVVKTADVLAMKCPAGTTAGTTASTTATTGTTLVSHSMRASAASMVLLGLSMAVSTVRLA